ncbi:hypothetical protein GALMADRAFT_131509 [Galerina marginata CBS 339.88]|uniref:Uncharacterized protein n=1 Tax=Galerina marginata (strain CBS 339.88) TaxID=685588 RepID=A0A067TNA3_GALM3|nr:hypothetical protein GALMADRAFT_131509 [Galerina marginata CBS 339.88]
MQSDHVPISAFVPIRSSRLDAGKRSVPLVDQTEYLNGIIAQIWGLPISDLTSPELVEATANTVAEIFADAFTRFSKPKSITSRSSPWWTPECAESLATYRASLSKHDWKSFRKLCKEVKRKFFEEPIVDIAYSNKRPWDLMNWVQKCTLPACEALSYQGAPCISLDSLWNALHGTYNSASGRGYDLAPLDQIPAMPVRDWVPFSMFELTEALSACSSRSAPGPDHISWGHLKWFVKSEGGSADLFLRIANGCLEHSHWPSAFKDSLFLFFFISTIYIPPRGTDHHPEAPHIHKTTEAECLLAAAAAALSPPSKPDVHFQTQTQPKNLRATRTSTTRDQTNLKKRQSGGMRLPTGRTTATAQAKNVANARDAGDSVTTGRSECNRQPEAGIKTSLGEENRADTELSYACGGTVEGERLGVLQKKLHQTV